MQGEGPILRPNGVNLHHELELAVILKKKLQNLDPESFTEKDAIDAIEGYALSLDMTARNVQEEAKKKGLPWSICKGFDTFTALSPMIPKEKIPDPHNVFMELRINGKAIQSDSTNLMIFRIPRLLATISSVMTLEPGDIILTGTPKGVGPCKTGDRLVGEIKVNGEVIPESQIDFEIADKPGPYTFKET
jgi:2-keto-4-pentenoate hydratase/2-oxohepta-3-ene-1,7-dioic acid hydratase in catechol pathway